MHRLLGDAEQRGDLLPAPATLAGATHLQLLDGLEQRPQRGDAAQPDLGIVARGLGYDVRGLHDVVKIP
jgi:hypothetical protein